MIVVLGLMMMINKNTRMLQCICFLAEMHKKCACKNNSNHPPHQGPNLAFFSLGLLLQTLLSKFQTFVHPQETQDLDRYAVEISG